MKKIVLTTIFCVCIQFVIFGSASNEVTFIYDSSTMVVSKPVLRIAGTRIYKGDTLLNSDEVLNILSTYPKISKQYARGSSLRSKGVLLIAGGVISSIGGMIIMINGVETKTFAFGYYNNSYQVYHDSYYVGIAIAAIGGLMLDGGVACTIVGKVKIRQSVNNYNATISSSGKYASREVNYQLGLLDNGNFGLRLTF